MSDRVSAAWGGFIELRFRDGKQALLRANDIEEALPRREGGTALRLRRARTILVDCPISEVIDAMAQAFITIDGGCDETGS